MPMRRELYPDDWEAIALRVKERADWRCEECGRECLRPGERLRKRFPKVKKPVRHVLTVAHLNHTPADCREENLRALCSVCHLRYDAPRRRARRAGA